MSSLGVQTQMEDGSVADGWRKTGGRLAGPGGGAGSWATLRGWPGPAGAPGVAGPPSRAGGGGIPRWCSWGPGRVPGLFPLVPGRRPRPCPAAPAVRARRPLPAAAGLASPRPARATARVPVPLSGPEPASPRLTWVSSPGLCRAGGGPGRSSALGAPSEGGGAGRPARVRAVGGGPPVCGGRVFSPGRLRLWGVAVAVGVSHARVAGGGRQSVVPGWCRGTAPVPGGPVAVRSRGGPRRPTRVPSPGSLWAVPLAVARGHPTSAAGRVVSAPRGRIPSVPLSVCPSASVPSPSAAPRGRAPACLASRARRGPDPSPVSSPPPPSRAGRGGAPAPVRSPERGTGVPGLAPPRAGRRVLAARPPPPRSGAGGRTDAEGARRPSPVWPGPGGVVEEEGEEGGPPPSSSRRTPPPALPLVPPARWRRRAATLADPRVRRAVGHPRRGRDRGGRVSRPGERPSRPAPRPLPASSPRGVSRLCPPPRSRHARLLVVALARAPTWLILPVAYACLKD